MRSAKVINIVALVFLIFVSPAFAKWQAGVDAINNGDFAKAFKELLPLAREGDSRAQYLVGVMYFLGRGVKQDYLQAYHWFCETEAQGYCDSQKMVGLICMRGLGRDIDVTEGASWYLKAANQGDSQAQLKMGYLYLRGQGVERDFIQSYKWLSLSLPGLGKDNRPMAGKTLQSMHSIMTDQDIDKAKAMAARWKEMQAKQRRAN